MDDVIKLISETVTGYDENGNECVRERSRELMCQVYGITRNEFYAASAQDMRPDITVRLSDMADYEGEQLAEYHGERYSIIRTYRDSGSFHHPGGMPVNGIELILQHKIGNRTDEEEDGGEVCPCAD